MSVSHSISSIPDRLLTIVHLLWPYGMLQSSVAEYMTAGSHCGLILGDRISSPDLGRDVVFDHSARPDLHEQTVRKLDGDGHVLLRNQRRK